MVGVQLQQSSSHDIWWSYKICIVLKNNGKSLSGMCKVFTLVYFTAVSVTATTTKATLLLLLVLHLPSGFIVADSTGATLLATTASAEITLLYLLLWTARVRERLRERLLKAVKLLVAVDLPFSRSKRRLATRWAAPPTVGRLGPNGPRRPAKFEDELMRCKDLRPIDTSRLAGNLFFIQFFRAIEKINKYIKCVNVINAAIFYRLDPDIDNIILISDTTDLAIENNLKEA
ncbi:hypothetical protein GQX74_013494 [Glossina fuscipes]|nr:hypothetical protein GQX74_013494 [Glossina fuscipes]